ncbi:MULTISPECIES: phage holin family protein [unclassified Janibacter]|uniref:phage holin family protein n=1 Tax=unclassified Janibacter TaxID=2649294 RepID=UPI003D056868
MQTFVIRLVVNAIALWVAAWAVDGITLGEEGATFAAKFATVALVALLFGVVNAIVKPIAKVLSFPFIILTLGLFTFIVNAFMLQITEWLSGPLGLSFQISDFFWDAVIGALIITLVSMVLNVVIPDGDE